MELVGGPLIQSKAGPGCVGSGASEEGLQCRLEAIWSELQSLCGLLPLVLGLEACGRGCAVIHGWWPLASGWGPFGGTTMCAGTGTMCTRLMAI